MRLNMILKGNRRDSTGFIKYDEFKSLRNLKMTFVSLCSLWMKKKVQVNLVLVGKICVVYGSESKSKWPRVNNQQNKQQMVMGLKTKDKPKT